MRKKIRLDADELEVLSFATAPNPEVRGTVRAAGNSDYPCDMTVDYYQTLCVSYPESYWGEETCHPVEDTDPSVCPPVDTAPPYC